MGAAEMKNVGLGFVSIVVLALSACSGKSNTTSSTSTTTTPSVSVAQALQALQANGTLPTLDTTSSLTGTDANSNGVRDDLDTYIAGLSDSATEKKALTQFAQAIQATMTVDTTNASALATASANLNRGVHCIWIVYPAGQPHIKVVLIEELSANTLARFTAYEKYNTARNGAVLPAISGNTCN
jgi:hypothetical protein